MTNPAALRLLLSIYARVVCAVWRYHAKPDKYKVIGWN